MLTISSISSSIWPVPTMRSTLARSRLAGCAVLYRLAMSWLTRSAPLSLGWGWAMGLRKPTRMPAFCRTCTMPRLTEVRPTPKPVGASKKVCILKSCVKTVTEESRCWAPASPCYLLLRIDDFQRFNGDLALFVGRYDQHQRMSVGADLAALAAYAALVGLVVQLEVEYAHVIEGFLADQGGVFANATGEQQAIQTGQCAGQGSQ